MAKSATITEQIRESLWSIVKVLYDGNDYESLYTAADKIGIDRERARQAYKSSKGLEVMVALILVHFGILPSDIKKNIPKIRKMLTGPGKLSTTENLIEEARSRMSDNEFIGELRTIIARDDIRTELGLKKRAGRPKKK